MIRRPPRSPLFPSPPLSRSPPPPRRTPRAAGPRGPGGRGRWRQPPRARPRPRGRARTGPPAGSEPAPGARRPRRRAPRPRETRAPRGEAAAARRWARLRCRGPAHPRPRGAPRRRASREPQPRAGRTSWRGVEAAAELAYRFCDARSGAPEQLARKEQEPLRSHRPNRAPLGACRIARWRDAIREDGDEIGVAGGDRLDRDLRRGRADVVEYVARSCERGEPVEVAPRPDDDRWVVPNDKHQGLGGGGRGLGGEAVHDARQRIGGGAAAG